MADNMMCPSHKDNKKYRDNYDAIFRKKKKKVKNEITRTNRK